MKLKCTNAHNISPINSIKHQANNREEKRVIILIIRLILSAFLSCAIKTSFNGAQKLPLPLVMQHFSLARSQDK
jgi:hypothetical protein